MKMKRLFLMAVAMLSMTAAMAENENENATNTVAAYNMSVNIGKLANALALNYDQEEAVEDIHRNFAADMMNAATASSQAERKQMVDAAVKKDLKYMHYVLSQSQYRKYLLLLNTTLNNRGLK